MKRRAFLKTAAMAGATLAYNRAGFSQSSSESRIEVLLGEALGKIQPEVYGHFTEHLGGVIYDGVWVGEQSKVANSNGIRSALVEKMRQIKAPVIRWPGGCFADSYDWQDGIGERSKRPARTNFWVDDHDARRLRGSEVQLYEKNAFGTDEFLRLCKLSGAEPYLAANLRSLPALSFDRWVEYCNSPVGSTTLARERAQAGSPEPYNVRYWGVGNESWGCGGNFSPEDYASEYRRFTSWVPRFGADLRFVASGPNGDDVDWTHRFFEKITEGRPNHDLESIWGWSVHHYAWNLSRGRTSDWLTGKGDALNFDLLDYYETLREADKIGKTIDDHWAALGQYDPQHRIQLVVDEYGPWYRQGSELDPTHVFGQQITMRDALVTALTLDTFNRNPEKVGMAACAQLINCLNALFLSHEDHFIVTPNFHVFDMYASHQGGQAVRTEFACPRVSYNRDGKPSTFWTLNGSASFEGRNLTVTVVNADASTAHDAVIHVQGGEVVAATAVILSGPDIHAHNSFEQPDSVRTTSADARVQGAEIHFLFPAASVAKVTALLR